MVLRRDEHASGRQLLYRMISAAMPIGHFHGLTAERQPEQLVAEADAKHWNAGGGEPAYRLWRVVDRSRIARTVAEEHPIGTAFQHGRRWRRRGHHGHSTPFGFEES